MARRAVMDADSLGKASRIAKRFAQQDQKVVTLDH
jgi:hypothetical protein